MPRKFTDILILSLACLSVGGTACRQQSLSTSGQKVVSTVQVAELPGEIELFESVFWEPGDTESLRQLLRTKPEFIANKSVLDIGTGSGLVAMCCSHFGASHVTATDVNPVAVACARHNAQRLQLQIDVRLVPIDANQLAPAFAAVRHDERFDVIISNPPWEDGKPAEWSEFALYDPDFQLLRSILAGAKQHLNPGGKLLLAYGCVEAIQKTHELAAEYGYSVVVLDDRELDGLPPVFLPGMLLGLMPNSEL